MRRQRLPIGLETFERLRETNSYYVDKTPLIAQMVDQGDHYFLSRPRRFGKSLLVDTLRQLFSCNEPLFRGLHIHDHWDWDAPHPVIRLSFGAKYNEPGDLEDDVQTQLASLAQEARLGPPTAPRRGPGALRNLLHALRHKTGKPVVVLVDEYDKPILDVLEAPEQASANRDYLRGFYGVLKSEAEHVRFVFVTGVSMFSKVSLFSGLNNLRDISLNPAFATICGYTEGDLGTVFAPELQGFDRDEIRRWYNGYNWRGGEKVYNPYDVLLLFADREFGPHWLTTATPTFLFRFMMERAISPMDLEGCEADRESLSTLDVGAIETNALLFQAGYLTISAEERRNGQTVFRLDYPNHEVRLSLNQALLRHVARMPRAVSTQTGKLGDLLARNDFEGVETTLRAFFASVPYQWSTTAGLGSYEAWYTGMLFACFRAMEMDVRGEESTALGRSDLVLLHAGQAFVIECKMVEKDNKAEAAVGRAMAQIRERGYGEKYIADGKPVHLLAMVFGYKKRNLLAVHTKRL